MAPALFRCLLFVIAFSNVISDDAKAKEKKELSPARLRAEGDAAFSNREYDKAIKYFTRLIDAEPTKHINFHKRALTYLVKNSYWKAVRDWSKALKLDDSFATAYLYRGKTYKKLGKCTKALTDLTKAQSLKPATKDISSLVSEAQQCVAQYPSAMALLDADPPRCDEAQPLIDALLAISPFSTPLNLGLAQCTFVKGDFQATLKYTANILRVDAQNLDVLLLRGKCYRQMGEDELALQHFKSGLKSDPEHKAIKREFKVIKKLRRALQRAEEAMKKLKWQDALDEYATALEIDPDNHHLLGAVFTARCKCGARLRSKAMTDKQRLAFCDEAIQRNPDDAEAYYQRGKAMMNMKRWDEAVANLKTAVSKNQGNREFQEELRKAEFEKKKANRKDYYGILGIAQHASPRELKKAFRRCGLEHHPDKVQDKSQEERDYHETMFKECVEAHDLLSDPEVRAKYDRGDDVLENQQGGNRGGFGGGGFPFGNFQQGGRTFKFKFGG